MTTVALLEALGLSDKVIHVPYDEGKAPVELLGGRVDAALQWPGQFISHEKAGTLKILCVSSPARVSALPDTPTCDEAGAKGVNLVMWRGLAAPRRYAGRRHRSYRGSGEKATESEEFIKASKTIGFEPAFADHAAFGEEIAADDKRLAELMTKLGLKK